MKDFVPKMTTTMVVAVMMFTIGLGNILFLGIDYFWLHIVGVEENSYEVEVFSTIITGIIMIIISLYISGKEEEKQILDREQDE